MLLALSPDSDHRIHATPGARATCPACRGEVLAKCGTQVVHHWAHLRDDCDPWSEGETRWHAAWKERFPEDWREVVCGCHRADLKTPDGLVVEFQHSSISPQDIQIREAHYGRVLWVFDATEACESGRLRIDNDGNMEWDSPRKSWLAPARRPWLDLGDDTLWRPSGKVYWTDPPAPDRPRGLEGSGEIWYAGSFINRIKERSAVAVAQPKPAKQSSLF